MAAGGYKGIGSRCLSPSRGKSFCLISLLRVSLCPLFLSTRCLLPPFFLLSRTIPSLATSLFPTLRSLCIYISLFHLFSPLPSFFFLQFLPFSGPVPPVLAIPFLQPRPKRSRIFFFFFLFFLLLLLLLLQRYLTTQRELVNILEVGRSVMQAVRGASLLPQEARLSLLVGVHVVRGTRLHLGAWSYREFL